MKKILLSLIAIALCFTVGCGQQQISEEEIVPLESVDISIETKKVEYNSASSGKTYVLSYDLPFVNGKSNQADNINQKFQDDFDDFTNAVGRHSFMNAYLNGEEELDESFFPGEVTAEVVQNGNGILSVCYTAHYLFDYGCSYGMTFDLATGELVSITDCFPVEENRLSESVQSQLKSLDKQEDNVNLSIVIDECLENFNLDSIDYIVRDGELIVITPYVQYPDGARMTCFVPCGVMLDGTIVEMDDGKPDTISEYLGMTVSDFTNIWGPDYIETGSWFLGGYYGFYYDDSRIPGCFYINDPSNSGVINPDDEIVALETSDINEMLTPNIPCRITFKELKDLNLDGDLSDGGGEFWDQSYYCKIDNDIGAVFGWEDSSMSGYPGIFIYRFNEPEETFDVDEDNANVNDSGTEGMKDYFLERAREIETFSDSWAETAMTQAEINAGASEEYARWDALINEIYQYLKSTLPENQFNALKQEQIVWVEEKEAAMDAAADEWAGGSGETMARASAGSEYTQSRCYELIEMIQ